MRLRPSGKKGPLAVQLSSMVAYNRDEAETWEHMALTRARPICGDASLMADVRREIDAVLAMPRDRRALATAIREMRELIAREKETPIRPTSSCSAAVSSISNFPRSSCNSRTLAAFRNCSVSAHRMR